MNDPPVSPPPVAVAPAAPMAPVQQPYGAASAPMYGAAATAPAYGAQPQPGYPAAQPAMYGGSQPSGYGGYPPPQQQVPITAAYGQPAPAGYPAYGQPPAATYGQASGTVFGGAMAAAAISQRIPKHVQGRFKHVHLFKHHGRYEMRVPDKFFPGREAQFTEPGGEEIVFTWPADAVCGDLLIIEW